MLNNEKSGGRQMHCSAPSVFFLAEELLFHQPPLLEKNAPSS